MKSVVLTVPSISCGHCESTIVKALAGQPGVESVSVDIPTKKVDLRFDESRLTLIQIQAILEEEDYPAESVETKE